jgi:hypothetical protein
VLGERQFDLCPIISDSDRQIQVQRADNNSSLTAVYTFNFIDRQRSPGLSFPPTASQVSTDRDRLAWIYN